MNRGVYVFSQIMEFVDDYEFRKCVERYNGEYRIRKLSCRQQFTAMIFGQLAYRESLRDIITCLGAHEEKLYHLGFRQKIARNTLASANQKRDWRIYRDLAMVLIARARPMDPKSKEIIELDLDATVYLLDSTVIDLCLSLFGWARFDAQHSSIKLNMQLDLNGSIPAFFTITEGRVNDVNFLDEITFERGAYYVMDKGYLDYERWHKIHQAGTFFVTRARHNMSVRRLYSNVVRKETGILCDQIVVLSGKKTMWRYPDKMRRIKYRDAETNIAYVFVTNDFNSDALVIAVLYKYRWQVELFFKWIKQHLKIKSFWGTSANAVKTQICLALCAYLLMAIIKKRLRIELDLYKMLQITSVSLLDKKPLKTLFSRTLVQSDVKGGQDSLGLQWF
ncbi:IS4 family transposase [Candidatus Nomurabacteria bacterium]|nr:IS4 family transposase [Candidatus Nomurabacteria bacterium]